MLKLLRLGMVPHSTLSYLTTLLLGGAPVCSLMSLSGGSDGIHPAYAAYFGPFFPHSDLTPFDPEPFPSTCGLWYI